MVTIAFAKDVAYIVNKYKTLSRHRSERETIDEFILDVLSKCKDGEIEILDNTFRINSMFNNPCRDVEKQIADALSGKKVFFRRLNKKDWEAMRGFLSEKPVKTPKKIPEKLPEKVPEESTDDGDDPFA